MKRLSILIPLLALLSGCDIAEHNAKVIDSEVSGLEYQCNGLFKYTDENGSMSCNHFPVAFMLGEIKLGIIKKPTKDSLVFPQDIVHTSRDDGDNKDLLKVLTLLQSLDEDQNPDNGIKIPQEVYKKLTTFIDIKDMNLAEIEELVEDQLGRKIKFKEPTKVLLHLQRSMKRYNQPKLISKLLEDFEAGDNNNSNENSGTIDDNNNSNEHNGTIGDNNSSNNGDTDNNSTNGDVDNNSSNENNSTIGDNNTQDNNVDNNSTQHSNPGNQDNNTTTDNNTIKEDSNSTHSRE